jgi:EAL domain-containing protein (putative c-di-GMP-specific phosphodiesterase class I)
VQIAKPNILIVDDDAHVLRAYKEAATRWGFGVQLAPDGRAAIDKLGVTRFDAIVSDVAMPGMDGLELLRSIRQRDSDVPVILVTGEPGVAAAARAVEYGAFRYLVKPVDLRTLEQAIRRAVGLHQVGRLKREAFEVAGNGLAGDRAALEAHFASAMDRLWMSYQPIVSWEDRRVVGYEALLRSSEPRMPSPPEMLDAAERLGKLHALGRAIRATVARDVEELADDVDVFVNLHASDLKDEELYEDESPLGKVAKRVILEVTERASLDAVTNVSERVNRLRDMGYRLAIDDLGAGYAGLTSFVHLDPAIAKIDMSLIRGIDTDVRKQTIARSLVRLCGDLGVQVIAEGVETAAERDMLVSLGCALFQGYLFAKPARGFPVPTWDAVPESAPVHRGIRYGALESL